MSTISISSITSRTACPDPAVAASRASKSHPSASSARRVNSNWVFSYLASSVAELSVIVDHGASEDLRVEFQLYDGTVEPSTGHLSLAAIVPGVVEGHFSLRPLVLSLSSFSWVGFPQGSCYLGSANLGPTGHLSALIVSWQNSKW